MSTVLPESWLTDPVVRSLTDPAHRALVASLLYVDREHSDGYLTPLELRAIVSGGVDAEARTELVSAGLWLPEGVGWRVARRGSRRAESDGRE